MAESLWLKIDGCDGEATDHKHSDEIALQSWAWGMRHPVSFRAGGHSGGETSVQDLVVTKIVDKASANLMKYCLSAKPLREVLLSARKRAEDPVDYLKIKMKNAIISSVNDNGNADGMPAAESVSLVFETVDVEYTPVKDGQAQGSLSFKWDLKANKEK